jgi:hypothetical protein
MLLSYHRDVTEHPRSCTCRCFRADECIPQLVNIAVHTLCRDLTENTGAVHAGVRVQIFGYFHALHIAVRPALLPSLPPRQGWAGLITGALRIPSTTVLTPHVNNPKMANYSLTFLSYTLTPKVSKDIINVTL